MNARIRRTALVFFAAFAGVLGSAQAAPPQAPPEIFAVVVGWNGGNANLAPLRFADDDAVRYALFFGGLASSARPGRVWLLTEIDETTRGTLRDAHLSIQPDGPPTRDKVLEAIAAAAASIRRSPSDRQRILYVVYAGHGLGGRVLLKPTAGGEAALTGGELRAAVADVSAADPNLRIFVFLDACRSESLFAERGARDDDFGPAIAALERRANAVPIGVLTAARSGRPAGEVGRLAAGYFSHVLTSGLAGAADADGDDVVTFGELAAFVAFNTQKLTGQMPWFAPPDGDLNVGAIDHRGRASRLVIPAGEDGRFLVGAANGLPVFAEAFKNKGHLLRLALPPGHYRVRREVGGQPSIETKVEVLGDRVMDLGRAQWRDLDQPRGELALASGGSDEGLTFSSAFSPDVVSTLEAGYHAGESPSIGARGDRRTLLAAELGVGTAPLGLGGVAPGLALRLQHRFGRLGLGLNVAGTQSSHGGADTLSYSLRRYVVGLEGSYLLALLGDRSAIEGCLSAGWSALVRSAGSSTTGDLASPWVAVGGRWLTPVAGAWSLSVGAHLTGALVHLSGDWTSTLIPSAELGLGVTF